MSGVGKVIGGVGKAVGGAANFLGGKPGEGSTAKTTIDVEARSPEERRLLEELIAASGKMPATQNIELTDVDRQIQNLFKTNLSNFLAKKQDGTIDPNALKSATAFIDETFTKPAEQQLQLAQSDYLAQAGAQQAALGRQVGDAAFQENLFKSLANQRAQLGSQRGQNIAALTQDLQFNQPIQQLQAGLQGLSGIGQIQQQNAFAPAFLNDLQQQAFRNKAALLNQLSGERFSAAGKSVNATEKIKDLGLVGNIQKTQDSFKSLGSMFSGFGGGGAAGKLG